MTVPTISDIPVIPAYSDANFETLAPAVLSALRNTFVAEMNAAIAAINNYDYGAAVNISKVVGLTAGRIPYGAGTGALANSANFTFESNRLNLQNDSGAQLRLTDSTGNYTDFRTDSDGNLSFSPTGDDDLTGVRFKRRQRIVTSSVGDGSTATATFSQLFDIVGSEGGKILIFVRRSSSIRYDAGMRTYAFYRFTEGGANNQASVAALHSALVHPGGGAGGKITDISATIGGTNVRDLIITITTPEASTYEVSVIIEGDRGNDRY